jgi:hypothetical protein
MIETLVEHVNQLSNLHSDWLPLNIQLQTKPGRSWLHIIGLPSMMSTADMVFKQPVQSVWFWQQPCRQSSGHSMFECCCNHQLHVVANAHASPRMLDNI